MKEKQAPPNSSQIGTKTRPDEKILVVKKDILFHHGVMQGFHRIDLSWFEKIITRESEFIWRLEAESNPAYKQIIPYLIFRYEDSYFLMQRKKTASESRLQSKFTLGIGGHIRQEDMQHASMIDWATREFHEEVAYEGTFEIEPLGLINDESNFVGQVHTGFAFLLRGDSHQIRVRSELANGKLLKVDECINYYPKMETWSQMTFDFLRKIDRAANPTGEENRRN